MSNNRFLIFLTDKDKNQFTLNDSAKFFSKRALKRREVQRISIQENDLPISRNYIDSISSKGAKVLLTSKWMNYVCVEISDSTQLESIMNLPFVKSNKMVNRTSNDEKDSYDKSKLETSIKIDNTENYFKTSSEEVSAVSGINYGTSFNQINQLGGDVLHNIKLLGEGLQIAVFDAGFPNVNKLPAFDSLRISNRLLGQFDFINQGADVYNPTSNSHGTNTLSCMAAWLQGQLVGTAPKASYYLFRTEDASSESVFEEASWVAAAEYADSLGVDIISSSLSYTTFDNSNLNYTNNDMNGETSISTIGADIAASKGILVVNSAGNYGSSTWQKIGAPADGYNVLSIGAVDEKDELASFSSKGPTADGRIKPDVCAQGVGAIVANHNGGIQSSNGTSFSCPIVAGMAACLWQAFPSFTNKEIANAIRNSASNFENPNNTIGYGIPNFSMAYLTGKKNNVTIADSIKNYTVFPVPFKDELTILYQSIDTESVVIEIKNILGNTVYNNVFNATISKQNIFVCDDLASLISGVYFLYLSTAKNNYLSKIVKIG